MAQSRKSWIDIALGASASVLLLCLMLLTFTDVVARYLLNSPIRGAFELTELALLVLIFCGLPLASVADEHVTMDFIDQWLPRSLARGLQRVVQFLVGLVLLGLAWQVVVKAEKIGSYGDTTDVLKVPVAPFIYLMAAMVGVTAVVHLVKAFSRLPDRNAVAFDPEKSPTT